MSNETNPQQQQEPVEREHWQQGRLLLFFAIAVPGVIAIILLEKCG